MRNQYNIFVVYFGLFVVFPGPCAIFGPENMYLIISLAVAGIVVLLGRYANKKSSDLRVFTAGSALLCYTVISI